MFLIDNAERADHNAHPAADAEIRIADNYISFIPVQGAGEAGIKTGRIFAVAALQREGSLSVASNMNPVLWAGFFADTCEQVFTG